MHKKITFVRHPDSTEVPTVSVKEYIKFPSFVTTTNGITYQLENGQTWNFFEVNLFVSNNSLDYLDITVLKENPLLHEPLENPKVTILNSSFGTLDLRPGTEAEIIECDFDADFKDRPTLISMNNAKISLIKSHFRRFINTTETAILHGRNFSTVYIESTVLSENRGMEGVIPLHDHCLITMNGVKASSNTRSSMCPDIDDGSVLFVQNNVSVRMNGSSFYYNKAFNGGVIYMTENVSIKINSSVFYENQADKLGGAIYGNKKARLEIHNSLFSHNEVKEGGSVFVDTDVIIAVTNTNFTYNAASAVGGAIVLRKEATLNLNESSLQGNTAGNYGGAVVGWEKTTINMHDTKFSHNTAKYGSSVFARKNSSVTLNDCKFSNNYAKQLGGALYLTRYVRSWMRNSSFLNNIAEFGGAVAARESVDPYLENINFFLC